MAKRRPSKTQSEIKKIKASNDAYYEALSTRDMRAMEKVWTCAADNMLIAPPANPRVYVGWSTIKRNWEGYWPKFAEYRHLTAAPSQANEVAVTIMERTLCAKSGH